MRASNERSTGSPATDDDAGNGRSGRVRGSTHLRESSPQVFSLAKIGGSAVLLAGAGVAGQAAAIVRELFVAAKVGASASLDALLVALVLPILISGIIAGSLRVAVVPAYIDLETRRGRDAAQRFIGAILTWSTIGAVVAVLVLAATPSLGLAIAGPGLSDATRAQASDYLVLVLPIAVFAVVSNLLQAACQIAGRFTPIAIALVVAPAVSLIVTVIGWDRFGLSAVAVGMTLGFAASVAGLILFAGRARILPPITLRAGREDLGEFMRHAVPLALGSAVLQFNLAADRAIATILSVGSVSILKFGQQLVIEPLGSVSSAWTTALYPALVRTGQGHSDRNLGQAATVALRYGLAVFVPLSVGVAALAPLIVDVVYQRGAFNEAASVGTAQVVVGFAPMLTLVMLQPIITGAHNTRRRGTLLGVTAVLNAISNVALNLILGPVLGVAGIALSTSITIGALLAFLTYRLATSEPDFDVRSVVSVALRAFAASLPPGIVAAWFAWSVGRGIGWPGGLASLLCAGALGLVAYLAMASFLRLDEPIHILRRLRPALNRRSAT